MFEDGFEFSTVNPQSELLLTVSVPVDLQMGTNPGDITVQENGHQLTGGAFTAGDLLLNDEGIVLARTNTASF